MATEELEAKVREALIKQTANDFCEYASKSEVYKSTVRDFINGLKSEVGDVYILLNNKEGVNISDARRDLISQVDSAYNDIDNFRNNLIKEGENLYSKFADLKSRMESVEIMAYILKERGVSERKLVGLVSSFEDAVNEGFRYIARIDKIVKRLAEIAEIKGVDEAMRKEVRYEVIRAVLPTPLDYRLHESKFHNLQIKAGEHVKAVLTCEEAGFSDEKNKETEQLAEDIKKYGNLKQAIKRGYIEHMVKEVYS